MLKVKLSQAPRIGVRIGSNPRLKIGLSGEFVQRVVADPYEGPYAFTPGEEDQTIEIAEKTAQENITVAKIPENYGRLIWDGHTLTVY